ncbi:T9SS C-terminal target domain-containing protein [Flavobacterium circumlabens]|uniref:Secreted protein (Por secretion system target) n=1 Tax=Flavobacterium circumlabens TaxID=2133765 RepID=A0A4Y7U978_9FLAO|nr:T9SS type A sorting domain-containing protein [Flavobacterium circumlabens]TCN53077.1 putative secreted protein (Por secretion system target) [Flavobacterium circumlabens]TEB42369.1 T9SS C-terminal target domain-containing protein [Flavobacterium circumlabens]
MKKFLSIILFCTCFLAKAQEPTLTFTYDPLTGNQTVREFCQSCGIAKPARESKETETLTDEDLTKISSDNTISYYPNPVKEELFLKWELIDENQVVSIQVVEMSGQAVASYRNLNAINTQTISFRTFPTGVYLVTLSYRNGQQKTIKIIKQ